MSARARTGQQIELGRTPTRCHPAFASPAVPPRSMLGNQHTRLHRYCVQTLQSCHRCAAQAGP
eukprot:6482555-Amphidinium_carterae.1